MIYVNNQGVNQEERRFLDSEIDGAIGTFKTMVLDPDAHYVCIEWVKNTGVLLPDRDIEV